MRGDDNGGNHILPSISPYPHIPFQGCLRRDAARERAGCRAFVASTTWMLGLVPLVSG